MSNGKINVHTENIFPIIKKFLYSDHEIFLRELVSNAVDATQKLKTLTTSGENKSEQGDLTIEVNVDKDARTITISDHGVGMTQEEVEKYINQIAFSGAEEFVNKYKEESTANPLIGHFGLGFYSSFMVSDKVELVTKSFKENGSAVKWECDGSPEYIITEADKKERGTDVTLHVNEESQEFLEIPRIETLLNKYCKFLPVSIRFNGKTINNTEPAWTKKPVDLTDADYKSFYKELYPFSEEPLFHIHLNVDYPFHLTGILYFPKMKKQLDIQKNKIQLYSNQVFVTDSVEGIVPEFLMLMHGVIDSPDIPLNVSRSYLQSDASVKKISNHITKKVADKLSDLFKNNRTDFENKWDDIGMFIKYGILTDEKFYDRAKSFFLFKNTDGKYFTIDEYKVLIELNQTDKNKKTVYIYASNPVEQHAFIAAARDRGYDVLLMEGPIDTHIINYLEQKLENSMFVRTDASTTDKLVEKENVLSSGLNDEQKKLIEPVLEKLVNKEQFHIEYENLRPEDQPVLITRPEFMRRMKDMSATGGGYEFMGTMPEHYNLIINTNHPLFIKVLLQPDVTVQQQLLKQVVDLALLAQSMLKGQELTDFINRSIGMIK
ncbi:MAG: molecular chaperone HtpG [Bacteroidia bacterium]